MSGALLRRSVKSLAPAISTLACTEIAVTQAAPEFCRERAGRAQHWGLGDAALKEYV